MPFYGSDFTLGSPLPAAVVGTGVARSFNGTTDVISAAQTLGLSSPFSIASWVFPQATSHVRCVVGTTLNTGVEFRVDYGPNPSTISLLKANILSIGTSSGTVADGSWSHIGVSWDGSSNFAFYINGAASGSGSNASSGTANAIEVGAYTTGPILEPFGGNLCDVAVWNTVLSSGLFASMAAGNRADTIGANANLTFYLPILGGSPELDKSGNGNNGTLTGTGVVAGPPTLNPWPP